MHRYDFSEVYGAIQFGRDHLHVQRPERESPVTLKGSSDTLRESSDLLREPSDNLEESSDTLKESSDSLKESSDTLREPSDTLKEPSDTLREPSDTLKASLETLKESSSALRESSSVVVTIRLDFSDVIKRDNSIRTYATRRSIPEREFEGLDFRGDRKLRVGAIYSHAAGDAEMKR